MYWSGVGATHFRYDPKHTMGDVLRGFSKRQRLTFHLRGKYKESELWGLSADEINDKVRLGFRVNGINVVKAYVFVGILDNRSTNRKDKRRIIDCTTMFLDTQRHITSDYCVKIQVVFKDLGDTDKAQCIALLDKLRMGWLYYGDPYATDLISCHLGFQTQFIPSVLVALCKEGLTQMGITVPTVEICMTWDSVGGKAKQTFGGVRAISLKPIFKGRKYATTMKAYLASTKDDSQLGPDIVDLIRRILEVRGVQFKCSQLEDIALMISAIRIFFVADRKAMQGFIKSPSNTYVMLSVCALSFYCLHICRSKMRDQFHPLICTKWHFVWIGNNGYYHLKDMEAAKERGEYKGKWKKPSWTNEVGIEFDAIIVPPVFHASVKAVLCVLDVWTKVREIRKNAMYATVYSMRRRAGDTLKNDICATGNEVFQFLRDNEESMGTIIGVSDAFMAVNTCIFALMF